MNVFQIKLLAVAAMVVSHVGIFFFPRYIFLPIIGSVAFPLFGWLIANGIRRTSNETKYLGRLFAFALVSQIPFVLANGRLEHPLSYLNIFFTLSLGLTAILLIRRFERWWERTLIVLVFAAIAQYLNVDYGAAGVLSVVCFYLFFGNMKLMLISQGIILGALPLASHLLGVLYASDFSYLYLSYRYEAFGLFSLFFIARYNQAQGYPAKFLFYAFYPIHYVVIFAVQVVLFLYT